MVLPRQLQRRLHRLGSAAQIHHAAVAGPFRCPINEKTRKFLGRFIGKETGMRKGDPVDLRLDRLAHAGVIMTKAGHGSTPASIQIALAAVVNQVIASAANDHRQRCLEGTVEDVGHLLAFGLAYQTRFCIPNTERRLKRFPFGGEKQELW